MSASIFHHFILDTVQCAYRAPFSTRLFFPLSRHCQDLLYHDALPEPIIQTFVHVRCSPVRAVHPLKCHQFDNGLVLCLNPEARSIRPTVISLLGCCCIASL